MACSQENEANLISYAAGAASASERERIERHLAACQECRAVVRAQETVWEALDAFPAFAPPEDFDRKLYRRLADEAAKPWWRRLAAAYFAPLGVRTAAPVAAACVALCVAFLFRIPQPQAAPRNASRPVAVEYRINVDQVERTLDDLDMLKQLTTAPPAAEDTRTPASQS